MQTAPDEASEYNYKEDSVSSSLAGLCHSLLVQTLTFSKFIMAEKSGGEKKFPCVDYKGATQLSNHTFAFVFFYL